MLIHKFFEVAVKWIHVSRNNAEIIFGAKKLFSYYCNFADSDTNILRFLYFQINTAQKMKFEISSELVKVWALWTFNMKRSFLSHWGISLTKFSMKSKKFLEILSMAPSAISKSTTLYIFEVLRSDSVCCSKRKIP